MNPQLPAIHEIWVYLSGSPLLALILTLSAYQAGVMIYERFDRVILAHGSRYVSDLAYREVITRQLPQNEYFGDAVREFVRVLRRIVRQDHDEQVLAGNAQ
mgnify:CR=1 FL=1